MSTPGDSAQLIVTKSVTQFEFSAPATLARYLAEVLEWNPVLSLISRKDPIAACERLLFESIELGQIVDVATARRIADVGSGAGFPGMVWALLFPELDVTLVERREKRALFLERTARTLGVANVTIMAIDLRDVSRETPAAGMFDVVSAVAVGEPAEMAADVEQLLASEGRFASTVSRETTPAARIGGGLHLETRFEGKFGCYTIYRRGV